MASGPKAVSAPRISSRRRVMGDPLFFGSYTLSARAHRLSECAPQAGAERSEAQRNTAQRAARGAFQPSHEDWPQQVSAACCWALRPNLRRGAATMQAFRALLDQLVE